MFRPANTKKGSSVRPLDLSTATSYFVRAADSSILQTKVQIISFLGICTPLQAFPACDFLWSWVLSLAVISSPPITTVMEMQGHHYRKQRVYDTTMSLHEDVRVCRPLLIKFQRIYTPFVPSLRLLHTLSAHTVLQIFYFCIYFHQNNYIP